MEDSYLKLQDQLCFPIYATSRLITRKYQPLLKKLELTYPQYLVMLVLWEEDYQSVSHIGERLYLDTNTLTPLIKKLVEKDLVLKERAQSDERVKRIILTKKGKQLKKQAESVPVELVGEIKVKLEELENMRTTMWNFLKAMEE